MGIISAIVFSTNPLFMDVITAKRYWFVQCILIYYVFAYLINKYFSQHLTTIFVAVTIAICCLYIVFVSLHDINSFTIYSGGYTALKWEVYFLFFLFGALLNRIKIKEAHWWHCILLFCCVGLWYVTMALIGPNKYQLLTTIPIFGILYFMYRVGELKCIQRLFTTKIAGGLLMAIGNLCLECYIIQFSIITDRWNDIFPFNIPLIWTITLLSAYMLHILTGLITGLFDSKPFNWGEVVRVI